MEIGKQAIQGSVPDDAGDLVNGELAASGEIGNSLAAGIVKAEGSAGGTDGDSGIPSAAKENVEGFGGDLEYWLLGLQPVRRVTLEELQDMYPDTTDGNLSGIAILRFRERHRPAL